MIIGVTAKWFSRKVTRRAQTHFMSEREEGLQTLVEGVTCNVRKIVVWSGASLSAINSSVALLYPPSNANVPYAHFLTRNMCSLLPPLHILTNECSRMNAVMFQN